MAVRSDRPFDVVTFDCYGTLIDWQTGLADAFRGAAAEDGLALDRASVLQAFFDVEPVVQAERYASYHDVLVTSAVRVGDRLGWTIAPERAAFLPRSVPRWQPFADTNAALERLAAAGYELGILSNVDDDLLEGTRRHFTVPFALTVTAQQVRSYKPAAGHFTTARGRIGARRWLHAAQSYFHDVVPAVAHGVPVAWINRHRDKPGGSARPDREFPTLAALADWLA